jgi:membrane-bound lytic murein transglycosylase D
VGEQPQYFRFLIVAWVFLMPRGKKKRLKRLQLWIELGTLVLLAGCGTFYSQREVFIHPAWRFWHFRTQSIEKPAPKYELPIPDHPSVDFWVRWFSEKKHSSFQTQLDRARLYTASSQEIFVSRGLPKDLIYVALIESGFSPAARSQANAAGIWQIVPQTGNRFGLEQNKWVDERRHPVKSAKAAARYLSLLFDQFGSWSLALAAYNAGENAVQGALDKSGCKSFWDLMEAGLLPAETRNYVPKVFAAVKIIRNPDRYGFQPPREYLIGLNETVSVPGGLKLSWVGKQIGVPERLLQSSNPELNLSITPPGRSRYELNLPLGTGDDLLKAVARLARHEEERAARAAAEQKSSSAVSYRVKPGETLSSIAAKHKCSVKALAALNGMKPSATLNEGRILKLPAVAVGTKTAKKSASSSGVSVKAQSGVQQKHARYLVRRGDTLSSIAGKFHVSVKTLCAQNRMSPDQKLTPGNILTISTSQAGSSHSVKRKTN